jgi:hypothetical protein
VKRQALGWMMAGAMLISGSLAAEPLTDLQTRLASMRRQEPIRLKVEVELHHNGAAPLHWNSETKRGSAVVVYGKRGPEVREQWWSGREDRISVWKKNQRVQTERRLLGEGHAADFTDPAGTLEVMLRDATLLSDEAVTWEGRPARLLVVRPALFANRRGKPVFDEDDPRRWNGEMRIWLDESGVPLALERSFEFRLGPALTMTQHQSLTFQQVDGRLLGAAAKESSVGTALAMLQDWDTRTMKVVAVER